MHLFTKFLISLERRELSKEIFREITKVNGKHQIESVNKENFHEFFSAIKNFKNMKNFEENREKTIEFI